MVAESLKDKVTCLQKTIGNGRETSAGGVDLLDSRSSCNAEVALIGRAAAFNLG